MSRAPVYLCSFCRIYYSCSPVERCRSCLARYESSNHDEYRGDSPNPQGAPKHPNFYSEDIFKYQRTVAV